MRRAGAAARSCFSGLSLLRIQRGAFHPYASLRLKALLRSSGYPVKGLRRTAVRRLDVAVPLWQDPSDRMALSESQAALNDQAHIIPVARAKLVSPKHTPGNGRRSFFPSFTPRKRARYLGLHYGPDELFAEQPELVVAGKKVMPALLSKLRRQALLFPRVALRYLEVQVRSVLSYGAQLWCPDAVIAVLAGGAHAGGGLSGSVRRVLCSARLGKGPCSATGLSLPCAGGTRWLRARR